MSIDTSPGDARTPRLPVPRWYVTAPHWEERHVDGELVLRPTSVAHAKEMGTMTTACGLWTYSWRKMLDLPFPAPVGAAPGAQMCRTCVTKVIEEW